MLINIVLHKLTIRELKLLYMFYEHIKSHKVLHLTLLLKIFLSLTKNFSIVNKILKHKINRSTEKSLYVTDLFRILFILFKSKLVLC